MILNPTRILGQTALRYANEIAVVNYERGRRCTFKELHDLTNRACNMLFEKFRLGEGNRVATLLQNENMSLLFTLSMKTACTNLWLGIMESLNVYATEVENCINAHPGVEQSLVVGIPDDQWGEIVHAEVILKTGAAMSKGDLIGHCKELISRYKVPKSIEFVEALPVSSVGKLLRREVRKRY
jgi:acyl-CoA synthetase (AMP-forming)/AMP-acid ligase II